MLLPWAKIEQFVKNWKGDRRRIGKEALLPLLFSATEQLDYWLPSDLTCQVIT
jgi:hypothetical protein